MCLLLVRTLYVCYCVCKYQTRCRIHKRQTKIYIVTNIPKYKDKLSNFRIVYLTIYEVLTKILYTIDFMAMLIMFITFGNIVFPSKSKVYNIFVSNPCIYLLNQNTCSDFFFKFTQNNHIGKIFFFIIINEIEQVFLVMLLSIYI